MLAKLQIIIHVQVAIYRVHVHLCTYRAGVTSPVVYELARLEVGGEKLMDVT